MAKEKAGAFAPAFFCFWFEKRLLGFFVLARLRDGDGLADVTDLEAREALHGDVLAQLADLRGDELADGDGLFLDEGLLVKADLLVELAHLALDDLLDHVRRLAGLERLVLVDILL